MTRPYVLPTGEVEVRRGLKSIMDFDALPGDFDYMRLMKAIFRDLETFTREHQKAVEAYEDGSSVEASKHSRKAAEAAYAIGDAQASLATALEGLPDKPIHPEYRHPESDLFQMDLPA